MRLERVSVTNYRNIDGICVCFNPESNYIIGENNLGKSNFLSMLATVCSGKGFEERDFFDSEKPIEINLCIRLKEGEQGFFGDAFSPEDATLLNIRYTQKITEAYPTIISADSNESLSPRQIRKINFFKYETTAIPSKELRLDTKKGTGLLIGSLIDRFSEGEAPEYLNNENIERLTDYINEHLKKIRSFNKYSIKATVAPNPTEMLTSMLFLSDGERKIESTGSGVQFMTMASVNLLCQIMELYTSKSLPFSSLIYTSTSGKKMLPLVFSIDEPEVHLHPYLQRSLIGFLKRVLQNQDADFADLLKKMFDIDGLDGQLIVVTHSTDALAGDYRNLIRFYKHDHVSSAVSGYALQPIAGQDNTGRVKQEYEKHLILHFPEIKEAFYSKCAVLIEGVTEYGCVRSFAEKIGISLDEAGIAIINATGEKSIRPIRHLLSLFAVPSVAMYDGDVKPKEATDPNEFYTAEPCFEIEIIKSLFRFGYTTVAKQIAQDRDSRAINEIMTASYVKKAFEKMGVSLDGYIPKKLTDVDDTNEQEFCRMYSAWFMAKKGVILGRIIGGAIPENAIPNCYRNAIEKAKEVADSV